MNFMQNRNYCNFILILDFFFCSNSNSTSYDLRLLSEKITLFIDSTVTSNLRFTNFM